MKTIEAMEGVRYSTMLKDEVNDAFMCGEELGL
jgi:hypothetical protein